MRYPIAVLFLFLGLSACQPNESADQGNAQIVAAAEAAAQAAQAAAQAAEVASRNAEAAAQAAETAGSTAQAAAAPAPTAAPAEAAAPAEGEAASVPAGGDGQNAAAEGDEAQNAAPADGGDSPQAEGEAAAGGEETTTAEGGEAAAVGDPAAGEALFTGTLGCYGCHGRAGGGGMGPSLADKNWIYGGDTASITESIANGRPGGMPAFGGQASEEDIANVVAYVTSLGGAPAATAPAEGGAEAEAAAPAEGGDSHDVNASEEELAAAAAAPIEQADPPDNTPVAGGEAGGSALDYNTAAVGTGAGYTHPNGMGADWADDGQAEPIEGPAPEAEAEGDEAQNAAPEDGGDSHAATGTEEQQAAAASAPIEQADPPDNTPVTGADAGGSALDYNTANVGQGEGYTHPNGIGSDWADDGQAEPVEGAPAEGDDSAAAPAEGDEAQNAAPQDGSDAHDVNASEEELAAAAAAPIEQADPPDNTPVTGPDAGSTSLAYESAAVGQGEGYTHPNGMGADWADDGQAEPIEGPAPEAEAEGDEAQNAAPEDGGDSPQAEGDAHAATGTEEQQAAAASAPIEQADPPDNTPVTGADAGGSALDYNTAEVGTGEGYTHPNGMGGDWAAENQSTN